MLRTLDNSSIWITGAGSGIGEGAAVSLAAAGARVVLSGRREDALQRVCARIADGGGHAVVEALDITNVDAIDEVVARIVKRFGRLDVLVHSAGMNVRNRTWRNITAESFDQLMRVNVDGAFNCCRRVLPVMREQRDGLIIGISSWAGRHVSRVAGGPYSASKHALNALMETINMEECKYGIRATALCPGEVATDILDERPEPPGAEERARMLQPEDMGEIIRFLAQLPPHVCVNDLLVSPTWNRAYTGR